MGIKIPSRGDNSHSFLRLNSKTNGGANRLRIRCPPIDSLPFSVPQSRDSRWDCLSNSGEGSKIVLLDRASTCHDTCISPRFEWETNFAEKREEQGRARSIFLACKLAESQTKKYVCARSGGVCHRSRRPLQFLARPATPLSPLSLLCSPRKTIS